MSRLEVNFSENLKLLRKKNSVTQKELAEFLRCSEKTVSKWECAMSIPDIEMLFAIARRFRTSVEALFSDINDVYFLGIDGGGTKTQAVLTDQDGKTVKTVCGDCCNPVDIGAERAQKVLREVVYEACQDIPLSSVVAFAGIAGGVSAGMKEVFQKFFQEFHFMAVENGSDNLNIIAAGLGEQDGITLILGTGVCSYLQKQHTYRMAGGKGYLIDNGGSAYNIGRDGLHAYFCEKDGITGATEITREIEKLKIGSPQDVVKMIYSGGKKAVAGFAKTVYAAARREDATAIAILKRNMQEAVKFVETLANELTVTPIPLVLAGGLTKDEMTLDYFKEALPQPERFAISVLEKEPVEGAVMLAKKLYERTVKG